MLLFYVLRVVFVVFMQFMPVLYSGKCFAKICYLQYCSKYYFYVCYHKTDEGKYLIEIIKSVLRKI